MHIKLLFNVRCVLFHFFHAIVKFCAVFVEEIILGAIPAKYSSIHYKRKETKSKEIRSFLGMPGYLDYFIRNYATLSAPQRNLTRNKTRLKWKSEEKESFEKLKSAITIPETMAYFDLCKQITLTTEVSFHEGLSAALF